LRRFICRTLLLGGLPGCLIWAQSSLERAVTLAHERRYTEAQQLLRETPEPVQPAQRIAFHRLKAAGVGDGAGAADEMRLALQLSPDEPKLLLGTAVAELQAGQSDRALEHARKAGDTPAAREVLGETYVNVAVDLLGNRKFRPAIDLLQQSLTLFPASARIRTVLGIAQYANAETEDAVATLIAAIALDPKEGAAYQCLSQIVLRSSAAPAPDVVTGLCRWNATVCSALKLRLARENGDAALQREAIAGLRHAPQADPVARCELARAADWNDRLAEARVDMEACVRFDPSPQNHYRLGVIYRRMGLADLAKQEMDLRNQLLQNDPEDAAAWLNTLKRLEAGRVTPLPLH
jgi:tetratricopeptide (TPR) repeat protein